jgi:protein-S-isoprenylcysteine O-methyltransferase Ste14
MQTLFVAVYLLGVLLAWIIRVQYVRVAQADAIRDQRSRFGNVALLTIAFLGHHLLPAVYIFTDWLRFADYRLSTGWGLLGSLTFAFSLWLFHRSHKDLASNWSVSLRVRNDHRLVTSGVYRLIRHPMYASFCLWALAQPLLLHNWIAGVAFIPGMVLLVIYRIPLEEKMMLDNFGCDYQAYMDLTGRFIPRLSKILRIGRR